MDTSIDISRCITLTDSPDPLDAVRTHLSSDENDILIRSVIPEMSLTEECIVGIDEAGRGPVLGEYFIYILWENVRNINGFLF